MIRCRFKRKTNMKQNKTQKCKTMTILFRKSKACPVFFSTLSSQWMRISTTFESQFMPVWLTIEHVSYTAVHSYGLHSRTKICSIPKSVLISDRKTIQTAKMAIVNKMAYKSDVRINRDRPLITFTQMKNVKHIVFYIKIFLEFI